MSNPLQAAKISFYVIYIGEAISIALYAATLLYQWRMKNNVRYGGSPRNVIIPIYEQVLWAFMVYAVGALIYGATTVHDPEFATDLTNGNIFAAERLFNGIFPLLFVQMSGVGIMSLVIPAIATIALVAPAIILTYLYKDPTKHRTWFAISASIRAAYTILIVGLLFRRRPRTYKNYTVILHTVVVVTYMAMQVWFHSYYTIALEVVAGHPEIKQPEAFIAQIMTTSVWLVMVPTTLALMIADTNYWRGIAETPASAEYDGLNTYLDFSRIRVKRKLDEGGHSVVYRGTLDEQWVAIKMYKIRAITAKEIAAIKTEISVSVAMHHPNIIRCFGFSIIPPRILTIYELCPTTLSDYIYEHALSETMLILMFEEVCLGVMHIHVKGFVHRDIKSDNVLLDKGLVCKIIDFGEARKRVKAPQTVAGTPNYIAPELIKEGVAHVPYTEKSDIFSLGVVLWEMAHPRETFYPSEWSYRDIIVNIGPKPYMPTISSPLDLVGELVPHMCDYEPELRPGLPTVLRTLRHRRDEIREALVADYSGPDWATWLIAEGHATGLRQTDKIVEALGLAREKQ